MVWILSEINPFKNESLQKTALQTPFQSFGALLRIVARSATYLELISLRLVFRENKNQQKEKKKWDQIWKILRFAR